MLLKLRKSKAQSITEYAVLMGLIVIAIVGIQVYMKRAISGKLKSSADDVGEQFTTGANVTKQVIQQSARREVTGRYDPIGGEQVADLGNKWSSSEILPSIDATAQVFQSPAAAIPATWAGDSNAQPKLGTYTGNEVTTTDYVVQEGNVGKATLGQHGVFDSGKLKEKNVFSEDTGGSVPAPQ